MNKAIALSHIFPSSSFIDVLNFFAFHPQEEALLARIVSATGCALIQVQRAVKRLIASGLVTQRKRGKKNYYYTNYTHPVMRDLKQLLIEEKLFSKKVLDIFKRFRKKIQYAFVFGSTARGDDTATSDIDFFFVGELHFDEMCTILTALSREFCRECNGVAYSLKDFQERVKNPTAFIIEVSLGTKIWICGDEDEFTKMAR